MAFHIYFELLFFQFFLFSGIMSVKICEQLFPVGLMTKFGGSLPSSPPLPSSCRQDDVTSGGELLTSGIDGAQEG